MKICIIKQLVDSFSSTKPAPCLMCSSVTGRGAERDDDWLPSSFGAPRGLKGADEHSRAHTRRNVSDGGGVRTTGTVIDTAAKRESGGGRDGGRGEGGIVCERRGGETSECAGACSWCAASFLETHSFIIFTERREGNEAASFL